LPEKRRSKRAVADERHHVPRFVALGAAAAAALLATFYGFEWIAERLVAGRQTSDLARSVNDARNSLIQLVGGAVLLGGLVFTARTYLLSRTTQRAERFTKAIDQLGNLASQGVRLGGVYALEMIAQEDVLYWRIIDQVLSAFVRQNESSTAPVPSDVQAALIVLGSRGLRSQENWEALDLRGANLRGAYCAGRDLGRALLNGAELDGANFTDSNLVGAQFENASMKKVVLTSADCSRCNLKGADLRGAEFLRTKLNAANMSGAIVLEVKHLTEEQAKELAVRPD